MGFPVLATTELFFRFNALNFYITLFMAFWHIMSMKSETNAVKISIIQKADPVKEKVHFCYYQLAKGIPWHTVVCKRRYQSMVPDKTVRCTVNSALN